MRGPGMSVVRACVVGAAVSLLAAGVWGAPLVVIDLPSTGGLGHTVSHAAGALQQQGFEVKWLGRDEVPTEGVEHAVVCCMSDSAMRNNAADDIPALVRAGGGLLYLLSSDREQLKRDQDFLRALGLHVRYQPDSATNMEIMRHEITEGTGGLQSPVIPFTVRGDSSLALVRQGSRVVAAAAALGTGRVVVLPIDMVSATRVDVAPPREQVRLLAQAAAWAAGVPMAGKTYPEGQQPHYPEKPQADTPQAPKPDTPLPPMEDIPRPSMEISSTAIWDIGGDADKWPEIGAVVDDVVHGAGLQTRKLTYHAELEPEPLVSRMPTTPSLLVLGSHREFSSGEAVAVGNHVRSGGALLAVATASHNTQRQLIALNRILAEFGLAVRFARFAGRARIATQPITKGVNLQEIPGGISVWGFDDWELVAVGNAAVASATLCQHGRVFVMDAGLLVADDKRTSEESKQLLANAVMWLIGAQ